MGTVVIGADTFQVYGDLAGASSYLNGSFTSAAVAWRALGTASADDQKRTLVMAARYLNALPWKGTPTTAFPSVQPLAWPRTGVTLDDGTAVDSATIPTDILNASYELAAAFAENANLVAQVAGGGDNVKSMRADGASVDFWSPGTPGKLPNDVELLIGQYLSTSATGGAETTCGFGASGTDYESQFDTSPDDDGDGFDLTKPL